MKKTILFFLSCFAFSTANAQQMKVHPDFDLSVYQSELPKARAIAVAPDDTVYVSSIDGSVYRIPTSGSAVKIISGLNNPRGLDLHGNDLIVSAVDKLYRLKDAHLAAKNLKPNNLELLYSQLPNLDWHGGRYIRVFGNALYVSIGAPFNIGPEDSSYGIIVCFDLSKSAPFAGYTIVARGIRDSLGMDVRPGMQPQKGGLYFSDNGQDDLGDNFPPEEINRVSSLGEHFGFPYLADTMSNAAYPLPAGLKPTLPAGRLEAHSAALGIWFYKGSALPDRYHGALFVAQHGSWAKKSAKAGYKVSVLLPRGNAFSEPETIVNFLGANGKVLGRPVDIKELSDGSLLISDDNQGLIYRLKAKPKAGQN